MPFMHLYRAAGSSAYSTIPLRDGSVHGHRVATICQVEKAEV